MNRISELAAGVYTQWRYCIRLENMGEEVVQLRERHWRIFSLSGTLETVRGRGVVGRVRSITYSVHQKHSHWILKVLEFDD